MTADRVEQGRWPLDDDPRDPWAEAWPDDDLGYADLCGAPWLEAPDPAAYRTAARALQEHVDALRRGTRPFDRDLLARGAAAAHVSLEWRTDRRPPVVAPHRPAETTLLRLATEHEPAGGLFGLDAVLGPWVEALDRHRDRWVLVHALAHWACAETSGRPPWRAFQTNKPVPPVDERAAVRAVASAPLSVWRAHRDSGAWSLEDLVGISERRVPDHPVDLGHAAGVGPLVDGGALLARLVPVQARWVAWAPMPLPAVPAPEALRRRVLLELVTARLRDRRTTVDDALRRRSHAFARGVHLLVWPT